LYADSAVDVPGRTTLFVFGVVFEPCKAGIAALHYHFVDFPGADIQYRRKRRSHLLRPADATRLGEYGLCLIARCQDPPAAVEYRPALRTFGSPLLQLPYRSIAIVFNFGKLKVKASACQGQKDQDKTGKN